MNSKEEFLKINFNRPSVKGQLRVVNFEDNGFKMVYVPSLNLSSYGNTLNEAKEMLNIVLDDYFKSIFNLSVGSALEELGKHGWERSVIFKKQFKNASYIDREGILKNFNLSEETTLKEELVTV